MKIKNTAIITGWTKRFINPVIVSLFMKRNNKGQFVRKNQVWTPTNMDNGYIDKYGRYKVYLPTHPRANSQGYVFRSIVHYEYYYGEVVGIDFDVHHKDGNKLNDSKKNLQKLTHPEHSKLHNKKVFAKKVCKICKKTFEILAWRLKEKGTNRGKYCSQKCYKNRGGS